MLLMRPYFSTAKSVPLIGLSTPSGPSPPGEADVVAEPVRLADQLEPEIRKLLLHARDQRVDAVMAIAGHQRVDISGVAGPVRGQHLAAAASRALIPQIDVADGNGGVVDHDALLR